MRTVIALCALGLSVHACTSDHAADDAPDAVAETTAELPGETIAAETVAEATAETTAPISASSLGPNDISILLPAPTTLLADLDAYVSPSSSGARGELLPASVYDAMAPAIGMAHSLVLDETAADKGRSRFRVLALRVDPCFTRTVGGACESQVRLIMQAIDPDLGTPHDTAVHLFYRQTPTEFDAVVADLVAMRALAPESQASPVLGVSPALTAQGLSGAYGTALKAFILEHCGANNFVRMTFMLRTSSRQSTWDFGGFEVASGVATPIVILDNADLVRQRVTNAGFGGELAYGTQDLPANDPDLSAQSLFNAATAASLSTEARKQALSALYRLENPTLRVPDETSCVSCHVANFIGRRDESVFAADLPDITTRYVRSAAVDRSHDSDANSDVLRIFGWFGTTPCVAERVANETAEALATLRTRYP